MSEIQQVKTEYVCFALPEDFPSPSVSAESLKNEEEVSTDSNHSDLLSGLLTRNIEGLSRVVPTMMCGEESATHVFHREAKRLEDARATAASTSLMAKIAGEEAEHERLLSQLRSCLPEPEDVDVLRRRAKYFFIRVASRETAIHFSRIAGLDSGVCITLNCMLHPSAALAKSPKAHRIWSRIWKDEASHVRASRQHVLDLGLDSAQLFEEGKQVRKKYADLIVLPLGKDFEDIGVDTDKLYRRIVGPEEIQ